VQLVTYALEALHEEAAKFSEQWAAENGVAAAAAGSAAEGSHAQEFAAAAAAHNTAGTSSAAAAAGDCGASQGTATQHNSQSTAAAAAGGVRSLFDLMARQVMQQWSSRQLLASGLPELLVEELYAATGKVRRCVRQLPHRAIKGCALQCCSSFACLMGNI
jgi:hypothetical protein